MIHTPSDDLLHLAEMVSGMLLRKNETVATAESCTAGLVSATLTCVPGASDFFWGGIVVYAADAKIDLAGLDPELLAQQGTVSLATTEALAAAIRDRSMATYGVAVTGWAGPLTGPREVVGRIFGAVADRHAVVSRRWQFDGDRDTIRVDAVAAVLNLLRQGLVESGDSAGV
tara:strand:+ start:1932 stop:2447 length:516 start_codon:yes stop_codon:yes gene_type:complete